MTREQRQSMTAARAFGHFLANREAGGAIASGQDASTIEERFAKEFSHAFLMPGSSIRRRFHELVESNRSFTPRHLIYMARSFYVSTEVMCRRSGGTGVDPRRHVRQPNGIKASRSPRSEPWRHSRLAMTDPNSVRHAFDPTCRLGTEPRLVV